MILLLKVRLKLASGTDCPLVEQPHPFSPHHCGNAILAPSLPSAKSTDIKITRNVGSTQTTPVMSELMNNCCQHCQGSGYLAEEKNVSPGIHMAWQFFVFLFLFTVMMGVISVVGSTSFAVWALIGAGIIYFLLSTGVVDLAIRAIVLRSRRVRCPHCRGSGAYDS